MGHSEMLLAVAGLSSDEIKNRTQKLASGDWSVFAPAEQLAFRFGHKLASKPAALTAKDIRALTQTFGRERAVDLIWYGAWCNYMTRVADAFQLPLERDNVFAQPGKGAERKKGSAANHTRPKRQ
jgi:alkylhydroperoxidase family enzyme